MKNALNIARFIQIVAVTICVLSFAKVEAQQGYKKDSLQIKVYAVIEYEQSRAKSIKVTKVFCDYCTENQIKHLKEIGYEMAYYDRYSKENVLKDGKKRLAIYLRIPKDKFIELRDE